MSVAAMERFTNWIWQLASMENSVVNTSVTVGDVGIDTVLSLALASASDGRCYAFAIPF